MDIGSDIGLDIGLDWLGSDWRGKGLLVGTVAVTTDRFTQGRAPFSFSSPSLYITGGHHYTRFKQRLERVGGWMDRIGISSIMYNWYYLRDEPNPLYVVVVRSSPLCDF